LNTARSIEEQALRALDELERLRGLDPSFNWARCAVIADRRRSLLPVARACAARGIPFERNSDPDLPIWQTREATELFALAATIGAGGAVDLAALAAQIQPLKGPWWALLSEAVERCALDVGEPTASLATLEDFLTEWGRELRRQQRGLLLTTVHACKGLEFDHLVVLDGGWSLREREHPDAARRLHYVALTRARFSAAFASLGSDRHGLRAPWRNCEHVEQVAQAPAPMVDPSLKRTEETLSLADVDLSFAARYGGAHPVHRAISALNGGDELNVTTPDQPITNANGTSVGRFSKAFQERHKDRPMASARVHAVIVRETELTDPAYRDSLRCERWEVLIPVVEFA
jgi:ATP-dependent DNA helicase RecQ